MCNAHPSLYSPQKRERGGLNAFTMSPTRWVELTNAKDIYFINNQNIYYHEKNKDLHRYLEFEQEVNFIGQTGLDRPSAHHRPPVVEVQSVP